jgi:hypothetical protein
MASKRARRRKSCDGKVRHASYHDATIAARNAKGDYRAYLVPYHCAYCRQFHIGHPPEFVRRAIQAKQIERERRRAAP